MNRARTLATGLLWIGLMGLGLLCGPLCEAADESVGDWGDVHRIAVRGAKTFTPNDVQRAMALNLDVQFLAQPEQALDDYLRVLGYKAALGYQRAGFPNVKAEARSEVRCPSTRPPALHAC